MKHDSLGEVLLQATEVPEARQVRAQTGGGNYVIVMVVTKAKALVFLKVKIIV